jgi:hypothetical protein
MTGIDKLKLKLAKLEESPIANARKIVRLKRTIKCIEIDQAKGADNGSST